jgi:SNF2 family DNA or RNA helicase
MTVTVDTTLSGKTLKISGAMSDLRRIEEITDTWANWTDRTLNLPAVRLAYQGLLEAVPEDRLVITPAAQTVIDGFLELARQEDEMKRQLASQAVTVDDYQFGGMFPKPWEHQLRMFSLAKGKKTFGYFAEMGTGKSRVIIDEAAYLFEQGHIDMCLVIAWPSAVPSQWIEEAVPTHMPDRIKTHLWVRRPGKKPLPECFEPMPGVLKFYALNIEQLSIASGVKVIEDLLRSVKDKRVLLVFDESSKIKHPHSKRTKAAVQAASLATYKRICTGTPITQGMKDLYAQMLVLDKNIIGANSFTAFRNRYCRMGGFESRQIVGYKNVEELMGKVQSHTFRIRKNECMDLPPKQFITRRVELTAMQKKFYNQMKDDYFIKLKNGAFLSGEMGAQRIMRLQQIASGFLPKVEELEDGSMKTVGYEPLSNNINEEVYAILENVDGKTIVFCRYIPNIIELMKLNEDTAVEYSGRVGPSGKEQSMFLFKNAPEKRVMIAQLDAASHGLDLNFAQNVIYVSRSWSYETDAQSQDRIHRGGQTKICSYYYLSIPGTVYDMVDDVLKKKLNMAKMCLDYNYVSRFI